MALERIDNWPRRLTEYVAATHRRPFVWGAHDCCTFVAGAVEAITGTDLMAEFRGQYDSAESARQALKEFGNGDLYKTLRHKLGNSRPGAQGRRGDIAYHDGQPGVVLGRHAMFVDPERGAIVLGIRKVRRVFTVG